MKRVLISIVLGLAASLCLAQESYEPTTTWPYLYDEFADGVMIDAGGDRIEGVYNIHLLHGKLHFIDGEMIREVNMLDVLSVTVGKDVYRNVGGVMMLVMAQSENGLVVQKTEIDTATLNSTGGAYGASSNTLATQSLTSLEFVGGGAGAVNHMNLKNSKDEGRALPVIRKTYLVFGREVVFASKRDVLDVPGLDREALGGFIKKDKTKWKNPQSLIRLVDFIGNELMNK